MKFSHVLPLVAAGSAFVLPSEQVFEDVAIENNHRDRYDGWYSEFESEKDRILSKAGDFFDEMKEKSEDKWSQITENSRNALDDAFAKANDVGETLGEHMNDAGSTMQSWMDSAVDEFNDYDIFDDEDHKTGHGNHLSDHKEPNQTVYQMIAESNYTTKLAKLINEFDDLVDALNSTKANYTVFAPTDKALSKIPEHAPKPSKEQLKKFLSYHIVPDYAPAGKVLVSHTFPTLLKSDSLGSEPEPQRLTRRLGLKGLTINFYSRIIAINILGTNGVIHGLDTPLFPPLSAAKEIDLFPGAFSTLELGLVKTGLFDKLNTTDHAGGTLFAPSNRAFERLGPKANAFLFSQYGLKYLKALLEYHVVPDNTLYSDAYYKASSDDEHSKNIPKGQYHVDLPTLLKDRSLSVDIGRYGGFISMKVNAFASVAVQDVPAEDGVLQVMNNVLVPPKKVGGEEQYWEGGEMSVEELTDRLDPFVVKNDL